MNILVTDDDQEILEMLIVFFKSLGHQVTGAGTGAECLKQVVTLNPDVVFLDIRLPDKNGIEVLKEIKKINKNMPVIMITGYKEAEKVIEAFRYGALDCLLKPFNFDYIKNLLPQIRIKSR
jgi:DNA-binding response OmpR family regulator